MKQTSESVTAFQLLAGGFCQWCEGAAPGAQPEVAASIWLAKLHAAALTLPEVGPESEDGPPDLPANSLQEATRNLSFFNGWYYRTVFDLDPQNTDEPVMGDVGDDLLDTYKDIKVGAVLFESGQVNEALWYWSFMHRIHWGKHAVGAMAALHGAMVARAE